MGQKDNQIQSNGPSRHTIKKQRKIPYSLNTSNLLSWVIVQTVSSWSLLSKHFVIIPL